jgi:dipeptidyl aminopeptidase/acylaminoacyl peptidase
LRPIQLVSSLAFALAVLATADTASPAASSFIVGNDAPAWSPDGERIAYTSFRHGKGELYTMDRFGGGPVRLTRNSSHDDHAAWSPDATKLAFASTRDGDFEIYVMNADGSGQRRLTGHPNSDYAPTWSPDGTRIAWRTNRDGNPEIYSMAVDGGDVRRLTDDPASDESPDWSRDGRIAFSSDRVGEDSDVYVMQADGSAVTAVTNGTTNETEPSWSPDGNRLLFVSDRHLPLGNTEVYVVDSDGSDERRLTFDRGRDDWPSWSPDGSRIVFTRGVTYRAPDVLVATPDGFALMWLTATAARLEIAEAAMSPLRAGRRWTLQVLVRDARGVPLQRAKSICRAVLDGRALGSTSTPVSGGVVRCAWRIPSSARGKLLRVVAGASVGAQRAEESFTLRVL